MMLELSFPPSCCFFHAYYYQKKFKVSDKSTELINMKDREKRKYPRVEVNTAISYICVDAEGSLIDQSMGIGLNISQSGLLLETDRSLETNLVSLMFVDIENNLKEIRGQVAYCRKNGFGMFQNGISFQGTHAENIEFAKELIRAYHYRKSDFVLVLGATA